MAHQVYLFWDNSNIFIPAQEVACARDGVLSGRDVRIQFDHLVDLARAGRTIAKGICVGSVPPDLRGVWDRLRAAGIEVELYERGKESGKEQGVDQCLQTHMLRVALDVKPPGVAVLLTGDGAGYLDGVGYHADLERMARLAWGIEVISWDVACNGRLREWAKSNGIYIPLEDHYDSVTFLEGSRLSKPVHQRHRPLAAPALQGVG